MRHKLWRVPLRAVLRRCAAASYIFVDSLVPFKKLLFFVIVLSMYAFVRLNLHVLLLVTHPILCQSCLFFSRDRKSTVRMCKMVCNFIPTLHFFLAILCERGLRICNLWKYLFRLSRKGDIKRVIFQIRCLKWECRCCSNFPPFVRLFWFAFIYFIFFF